MRHHSISAVLACSAACLTAAWGDETKDNKATNYVPKVQEVRVTRTLSANSFGDDSERYTQIAIWFVTDDSAPASEYRARLLEVDAITDDAGKQLISDV